MTRRFDVCLNLILPNDLKDQVLDRLLKHPDWVGPFTTHRVEGHGDPASIASPAEQVRGRADRVRVEILMDAGHVDDLLGRLRADLSSRESVWWLAPVMSSGSFV